MLSNARYDAFFQKSVRPSFFIENYHFSPKGDNQGKNFP